MTKKYGKSTLGAMAARNTRVANAAKKAVSEFKSNVTNILKEGLKNDQMSNIQRQKILKDIEKLQDDSSNILTALYEYSEELREKNESFILYDSLLDEFKQHMSKIDELHNKLVNYQKSITNSITDIKHDIVEYPLETNILDERSQQIKELRSSVYGIHDMYIEIGDMVDYQGDQLDNIENNMLNAVFDSRVANEDLRSINNRNSRIPKSLVFMIILILFLILVTMAIYRKIT